jgi:hypothetical protein
MAKANFENEGIERVNFCDCYVSGNITILMQD